MLRVVFYMLLLSNFAAEYSKLNTNMKKVTLSVLAASLLLFASCGGGADAEKAKQDSIAAAAKADSIAQAEAAAAEAAMAAEKATADSLAAIAKADSIAAADAAAKGGKKPSKPKKKEEPKKDEPKDKFGAATGGKTEPSKFDKVTGGDKKDAAAPKSKFDKVIEKK